MNYFKVIQIFEDEFVHPSPSWKRITNAIISCKKTEFLALTEKAKRHKQENNLKEFHRIVQNVMKLRKQNTSVQEIVDPLDIHLIIHEPDKLRHIFSDKYCTLFNSNAPRTPFQIEPIDSTTLEETEKCIDVISQGKGMGLDCIPDTILKLPISALQNKLLQFTNLVFKNQHIPSAFSCARLRLLNKLKVGTPTIDDLRPIIIISPMIKLIESIALKELKAKLEPEITAAQTGFIQKLGTQVHILRLLGRIFDIRNSPRFKSGRWLTFFIDFKSAFDNGESHITIQKASGFRNFLKNH